MKTKLLIWDLPTRLFHWMLAGSFFLAFTIGYFVDDDSPLFSLHMLAGASMAMMVLLRIIWGFVGSRYAKFSSFAFGPVEILAYIKGVLGSGGKRYLGHNPGSSLAIWAMLALTLVLASTGALMSIYEIFEEIHEIAAYALLAVVGTHVLGVIVHTLKHRENITLSMIHGHKDGPAEMGIKSMHPFVALTFLALTGIWSGSLVQNYDRTTGVLIVPLVGTTLTLGEGAENSDAKGKSQKKDHDDDDHDD